MKPPRNFGSNDDRSEIESLLGMYLTDDAPPCAVGDKPQSTQHVQVVLQGNLPVRAGLWLSQYAQRLTREGGVVALLRLNGEKSSLELLTPAKFELDALPEECKGDINLLASWARSHAAHVLISLEEVSMQDGERRGEVLAAIAQAEVPVRFLSGGDDAAVVGVYGILKALQGASKAAQSDPLNLGLVIVGSEVVRAKEVADRINDAAKRFLGVEVELAAAMQQMDVLYCAQRENLTISAALDVTDIAGIFRVAEPIAEDQLDDRFESERESERESESESEHERERESEHEHKVLEPVLQVIEDDELRELFDDGRDEELEDIPEPKDELLAHFPQYTSVAFSCSIEPEVRLALDDKGILHLIATEDNLRALRSAEAWAKQEAQLLAAALNTASPIPALDLLVTNAAQASDLHRSGILLHLLLPDQTTVALNTPKTASS